MSNLPTAENPKITFVKKAKQWCTTYFDDKGKQIQEWSLEKPNLPVEGE